MFGENLDDNENKDEKKQKKASDHYQNSNIFL